MALVICHECGKEISTRADICPGCGNPQNSEVITAHAGHMRVTRTGGAWEGAGFLVIFAAMAAGIAGSTPMAALLATVGFVVFIIGRCK